MTHCLFPKEPLKNEMPWHHADDSATYQQIGKKLFKQRRQGQSRQKNPND